MCRVRHLFGKFQSLSEGGLVVLGASALIEICHTGPIIFFKLFFSNYWGGRSILRPPLVKYWGGRAPAGPGASYAYAADSATVAADLSVYPVVNQVA